MGEIVAEAVRRGLATQYAQGFMDGITEMLDQLADRSTRAPHGGYRGPMPPELERWLEAVRQRVDKA